MEEAESRAGGECASESTGACRGTGTTAPAARLEHWIGAWVRPGFGTRIAPRIRRRDGQSILQRLARCLASCLASRLSSRLMEEESLAGGERACESTGACRRTGTTAPAARPVHWIGAWFCPAFGARIAPRICARATATASPSSCVHQLRRRDVCCVGCLNEPLRPGRIHVDETENRG